MTAYAVAHLRSVDKNAEIVEYLQRIDATLAPFGGHFIVQGAAPSELEGDAPGTPIVIEFPSVERARAWYDSSAYRQILPLRTRNSAGIAALVEGVPNGYRAVDKLATLLDPTG